MISFTDPPLEAPDGCIAGVLEELHPGLAAKASCRVLRAGDELPATPGNYLLDHYFARASRVEKALGVSQLEQLRRAGAAIVLLSHDEALLEQCADEIWWL